MPVRIKKRLSTRGKGGEEMIGFLKRLAAAIVKEKPVMRVLIQKYDFQTAKRIIAEMNKEYGESHTLYIEVRF